MNIDKKELVLDLVDLLAVLTSDKATVVRTITLNDVTYFITRESGTQLKIVKS